MKTNIAIVISAPIPHLAKFSRFLCFGPKCCQPIKLQDSLECNISRKVNDEVYFWDADKHRSVLQVILSVFSQACPNYPKLEVSVSLEYPQKIVGAEVACR